MDKTNCGLHCKHHPKGFVLPFGGLFRPFLVLFAHNTRHCLLLMGGGVHVHNKHDGTPQPGNIELNVCPVAPLCAHCRSINFSFETIASWCMSPLNFMRLPPGSPHFQTTRQTLQL